jgi:hypothetical protein
MSYNGCHIKERMLEKEIWSRKTFQVRCYRQISNAACLLSSQSQHSTVDLTISGCKFNSHDDKSDAAGNESNTTPVAGTAVDATITQFPYYNYF